MVWAQEKMEAKQAELASARGARTDLEKELDVMTAEMRKLQARGQGENELQPGGQGGGVLGKAEVLSESERRGAASAGSAVVGARAEGTARAASARTQQRPPQQRRQGERAAQPAFPAAFSADVPHLRFTSCPLPFGPGYHLSDLLHAMLTPCSLAPFASQKRIDKYEARVADSRLAEVRWRAGTVRALRMLGLLGRRATCARCASLRCVYVHACGTPHNTHYVCVDVGSS